MTSTRRMYSVDHNTRTTTKDESSRRSCRRAAVQARLPAEDRLLPKPAGDAPDRQRQVRHARAPGRGWSSRIASRRSCVSGRWTSASGSLSSLRARTRLTMTGSPTSPLARMFNPSYGVFEYSAHDSYMLQINLASDVNPRLLQFHRLRPRPRRIPPSVPHYILSAGFL